MWILDSGTSDHVYLHIKYFSIIQMIQPIHIKFPNGNTLMDKFFGTIILDTCLHLHNVLFIPEFHFSLILISRPCRNFQYHIHFSHISCHIQDMSTKMMFGNMILHNNLYILHKSPSHTHRCCNSTCYVYSDYNVDVKFSKENDIWHNRIGHPSN